MADQKRKYIVKKRLTLDKKYRQWNDWEVGDIVVGKVVGTHYDEKYEKNSPIINVEECFFKKEKAVEYVGKDLVLNHCGKFAKAYPVITEGDIIQVEYTGKGIMGGKAKYAGKEAHGVDVMLMTSPRELADEEDDGL